MSELIEGFIRSDLPEIDRKRMLGYLEEINDLFGGCLKECWMGSYSGKGFAETLGDFDARLKDSRQHLIEDRMFFEYLEVSPRGEELLQMLYDDVSQHERTEALKALSPPVRTRGK
ncbi:MAG: hypothetical protein ACOYNL_02765 [Rickettsiales bacterium]